MISRLKKKWRLLLATGLLLGLAVVPATAQTRASQPHSSETCVIRGVVLEGIARTPVTWAEVVVDSGVAIVMTDGQGRFEVTHLAPGEHTIRVTRIGYKTLHDVIVIADHEATEHEFLLEVHLLETERVVVSANLVTADPFTGQTPITLSQEDLNQKMGVTVAQALKNEVGVTERSMGAAPARPVVRGLSDNRLLVLEDGAATGDLSATSADHAVTIEPLAARKMDIVRGPAALLYGSSVLGGVVNIERGYVPTQRPNQVVGTFAGSGESVNSGGATQIRIEGPIGPGAVTADASFRSAGEIRTPTGVLNNTQLETWSGALGASLVGKPGYLGMSVSNYESNYGIPGGFMGGHPFGANVELEKRSIEGKGLLRLGSGTLQHIETDGRYSRYFHRELEGRSGVCGVSFGQLVYDFNSKLTYRTGKSRARGVVGVSGQYRDYSTGCLSFIPPTIERTIAAYAYNEVPLGAARLKGSLRYEQRDMDPSRVGFNKAGQIRPRAFQGVSGGLALETPLQGAWSLEAALGLAFRPPALEELYAEGPHLASFAYEIGNADLDAERGLGGELALVWSRENVSTRTTLFVNRFKDYIHVVDTGELEYGPGEEGFLARYQYRGEDARFVGAEFSTGWWVGQTQFTGSMSYVQGTRLVDGSPLPRVPPFMGQLSVRHLVGSIELGAGIRGAAEQDRLGEFEEPTAAYLVGDVSIEWRRYAAGLEQAVVFRIDNIADTEYRNHLSRVKSIMPEPGRNIALLFRLSRL